MTERKRSQRIVQATLAVLSLASLVLGMAIYLCAARIGITQETARFVSTAFLAAAIVDALVLYLWERIFKA